LAKVGWQTKKLAKVGPPIFALKKLKIASKNAGQI